MRALFAERKRPPDGRPLPAGAFRLPITHPNDRFEREADTFADRLVSSPERGGRPRDVSGIVAEATRQGWRLGDIRIYEGEPAARSAAMMGARAYTVGGNVVFGRGQYSPGTSAGQRLIAHELAHVAQQQGRAPGLSRAPSIVMRTCAPSPLPSPPLALDAVFPLWSLAERCIVNLYKRDHRGHTVAHDIEWLSIRGKDEHERRALRCLRGGPGGPHFTARSGVFPGKPDIWDFTQGTMYEITTRVGAAFRRGKLAANTALATSITSPAECGGRAFTTGTWTPRDPSYSIGPGLWMSAGNRGGVIVYSVYTDGTAAVSTIALLAALKAAKRFGKQLGKKAAGGPALAAASVVAAIVLIGSGRAEAKIGPGDEDPLETLFKALEQEGVPVPQELRDVLDADPALKERIAAAMREGNSGEVNEALSRAYMNLIARHKNEFTAEELEYLLTVSQLAGDRLPQAELTIETLRKMADQRAAGGGGEGGSAEGGAAPGETAGRGPTEAEEAGPVTETEGGETAGGVPTLEPTPPTAEVTQRFPELSSVSRRLIAGAPAPVRRVFDALTSRTGEGFPLDDAIVTRFFRTVPPDLQDAEADTIIGSVEAAPTASLDDVFLSLEQAVTEARAKSAAAAPVPSTGTAAEDVRRALADVVATSSFAGFALGEHRVLWGSQRPRMGERLSGTLLQLTSQGQRIGGFVTFVVVRLERGEIDVRIVGATDLVDTSGAVVIPASRLRGRVLGRRLLGGSR